MSFKKEINELTKEDLEKIGVWDIEKDFLIPFFFEAQQEILTPFYHDIIEAKFYVKCQIYKNKLKHLGVAKFSADLFYQNDDYKNLDLWWFREDTNKIQKIKKEDLPLLVKINFQTYPFFNNYLIILCNLETLEKIGKTFLKLFNQFENLNILLTGDLGSGKTTFVNKIIKTTSPSFNLMNSIKFNDLTINHWDLYRIEPSPENLKNLDFWFYLNQPKTINLIEWANKIKLEYYISNVGKENLMCVNLSFDEDLNLRYCTISFFNEIEFNLKEGFYKLLMEI